MENSGIAWTTHTFNAWEGCQKLKGIPECDHCYAADQANRFHPDLHLWGPGSDRLTRVEDYWKKPFTWNRQARISGETIRVFCGSLMDVCDMHPTARVTRPRLIETIEQTPQLTWQLLSKRPGKYPEFFWDQWPSHVWAGTSAGSPWSAERMIPKLIKVDAPIRFVSVEPFLQDFDITPYLPELDWVIIGGESGPDARSMNLNWVERMVGECLDAGVAVFVKQMGSVWSRAQGHGHSHGTDMAQWPASLRIQQFPRGPRAHRHTPYSGIQKERYVTR